MISRLGFRGCLLESRRGFRGCCMCIVVYIEICLVCMSNSFGVVGQLKRYVFVRGVGFEFACYFYRVFCF